MLKKHIIHGGQCSQYWGGLADIKKILESQSVLTNLLNSEHKLRATKIRIADYDGAREDDRLWFFSRRAVKPNIFRFMAFINKAIVT